MKPLEEMRGLLTGDLKAGTRHISRDEGSASMNVSAGPPGTIDIGWLNSSCGPISPYKAGARKVAASFAVTPPLTHGTANLSPLFAAAVFACFLAEAAAFSLGHGSLLKRQLQSKIGVARRSAAPTRRASSLGGAQSVRASSTMPGFAPPGGVPSSYAWEKQWYPIFLEEFQQDDVPFPFTLMGHQIVFWKDKVAGEWRCMADRCPHRLVPLSEGRVTDAGEIECPYHGWTFEGQSGECTKIPHAPDNSWSKKRSCGVAVDVVVKQGVVWVWPENLYNPPMFGEKRAKPDEKLIPIMDVIENEKDIIMDDVFRDVPYDWSLYVENVLDVSHVSYTHHGTQGSRKMTKPFYFEELRPVTDAGFELESVTAERKPTGQGRNTKFVAPSYLHHTVNFGTFTMYVATMAVPTKPGYCRIIGRFPAINAPDKLKQASKYTPTFLKHLKRMQVLEDDNIFLHVGERSQRTALGGLPMVEGKGDPAKWAKANYQATEADMPVINLQKWFDKNLPIKWAPGTWLGLEPELPREQLLDRWHSHTKNCKACLRAVRRIKKLRVLVACLGVVAAVAGMRVTSAAVSLAISGLCALGWAKLGELHSRFFKGPYPPVRNVVPKEPKWEKLLAMAGQEVKSRTENLNVLGKTSFVKKDV